MRRKDSVVSSADKGPKLRLGLSRCDSFFVIVNESSLVSQRPCKLISFGVGFRDGSKLGEITLEATASHTQTENTLMPCPCLVLSTRPTDCSIYTELN